MPPIRGIYALCDNSQNPSLDHGEIARDLLAGGVRILQLRIKGESDPEKIRRIADKILAFKKNHDFTFILNDWPELAKRIGADGTHVGQDDMPIREARRLLGEKFLIGYSSHSLGEAIAAERAGASYVAFGAIFPTANKGPTHPIQGVERLAKVVDSLRVPVVAIGGINRENFASVAGTGVAAIAMIGALTQATDIAAEAGYFVSCFEKTRKSS